MKCLWAFLRAGTEMGRPCSIKSALILSNLSESWNQRCFHGHNHNKKQTVSLSVLTQMLVSRGKPCRMIFSLIKLKLLQSALIASSFFPPQLNALCIQIAISCLVKLKQLGVHEKQMTVSLCSYVRLVECVCATNTIESTLWNPGCTHVDTPVCAKAGQNIFPCHHRKPMNKKYAVSSSWWHKLVVLWLCDV